MSRYGISTFRGEFYADTLQEAREIARADSGAEIYWIPEAHRPGRDCAQFGCEWEHYGEGRYHFARCKHCGDEWG